MSSIPTAIKAIRAKCLDCCGGSAREVRACELCRCPLYPYRMGKHPTRQGRKWTPEEYSSRTKQLALARSIK